MPTLPQSPFALRSLAALLLGCAMASPALAQWQWIDNTGRKVFSDTAPPAGVPEKNILKRPSAGSSQATRPAPAPAPSAAAPLAPAVDKELEARKKAADEAEAAKKKEQLAQQERQRADNCERARQAKATLDSGQRVATVNAKGEREIMDDARRASETQRLEQLVRSDCGPLPPSAQATQ